MGTATKIEWCDHSASPWHGCSRVHTGCTNCYAETMAKRNPGTLGAWGPGGTRVASKSFHDNCRRWNTAAAKTGERQSVFPSICDPFDAWDGAILDRFGERLHRSIRGGVETQPVTMGDLRAELFATIDSCPWLDFLLLTKRPGNIRRMWPKYDNDFRPGPDNVRMHLPNVSLIYSASDQASLEAGIGELVTGARDLAPVLGLSLEPLIGPIDLGRLLMIDWVIVGGESGPHARPCDLSWIRSIVAQCKAAQIPCFVKQLGANVYDSAAWEDGNQFTSYEQWVGKAGSWLGGKSGGGYRYKKSEKVVCVDAAGRICSRGEGFMRARDEGTFPVKWHFLLDLADGKGGDIDEFPADLRVREFPEVNRA